MQLEKVTAFVTRTRRTGLELLLFRHPFAGIQLPAGTVEETERADAAAIREIYEETGLTEISVVRHLGAIDETLPDHIYVARRTKVFARPDFSSFDWAEFRRGIAVKPERTSGAFTQITYEEWDNIFVREFVTYRITGWVPTDALAPTQRRYLFHLITTNDSASPNAWTHPADNHIFAPFWAPLAALPPLVEPQQRWLEYVMDVLGYSFSRDQPG